MSLVDREVLLSFTHGIGNGPTSNDIANLIKTRFDVTAVIAQDLTENDFVEENIEPNVTKKKIRGPLNLRRHNENKLHNGDLCLVEGLDHSPKMLVEHIAEADDPEHEEKKIPSASCIWFVNNELQRQVFKVDNLKKYIKEEPPTEKKATTLNELARAHAEFRDHMFEGRKINAIKVVREYFDLGLKESKDLVETVSTETLYKWRNGIFQ